ncbi:MAG: NAD(P)H-binding protein, partial [Anaerolineales bacterium]|nr:NAD(P)H-binding protein [Anaerolineales bacterium]
MNKIVILGATGRTGYHLVEQALALGYEVVAYVRAPEKLTLQDKKLHIVAGELHEQAKLEAAIQGAVAVVSGLGPVPKAKERPLTTGMQVVVAAMKAVGVERLIVSTG